MTTPLKIVFYRPHIEIWYKNPVMNHINKNLLPTKYAPLLDYALSSDAKVYFATSFVHQSGVKGLIKSILDPLMLIYWCRLNKISWSKVGFIFTKQGLRDKDALLIFHYGNFTHEQLAIAERTKKQAECLAGLPIFKVLHLTHYIYRPDIGFANLNHLSPDLLVAENNLSNNSPFFQKFFGSLKTRFELLPYTFAARFVKKTPFKERINKLVATGSITFKMTDAEFISFYQANELQPMRRILFEHASEYSNEMESLISDLNASREIAKSAPRRNLFQRIVRRLRGVRSPQLNYYKKDIVTVYNEYKMFVVPEEICDLPAIGFVEGMACGCAYIGLDNPMFRDIGLVPGTHYIAYDGSLPDLMSKVQYYQQHSDELEAIANCGYEYVVNHLSPGTVYKTFFQQLKALATDKYTNNV